MASRSTLTTPMASVSVSSTRVAAPVARDRYQSAIRPRRLDRRPAAGPDDGPVAVHQAGGQASRGQPRRGLGAEDDRGRARRVRPDAARRRDADRPPDDRVPDDQCADRRCDGAPRRRGAIGVAWCSRWPGRLPPARTVASGAASRWPSAIPTGQPPGGGASGGGDVAAEADQHAVGRDGGGGRRPRDRRPAPWRSRRGPGARRAAAAPASARGPGGRIRQPGVGDARTRRGVRREVTEVAVVAGGDHRGPDRGVDEPARLPRGLQRHGDGLHEQRPDERRAAVRRVQPAQLGVIAKAAARPVDRDQLALDRATRAGKRGGVGRPTTTALEPSASQVAVAGLMSRPRPPRAVAGSPPEPAPEPTARRRPRYEARSGPVRSPAASRSRCPLRRRGPHGERGEAQRQADRADGREPVERRQPTQGGIAGLDGMSRGRHGRSIGSGRVRGLSPR